MASPIKRDTRAKIAKNREDQRYQGLYSMIPERGITSSSVTPVLNASDTATKPKAIADTTQSDSQLLIAQVGDSSGW